MSLRQLPGKQYNLQSNYNNKQYNKIYLGLTSSTFKNRYSNHKASFNRHNTELSNYIWKLKETKQTTT